MNRCGKWFGCCRLFVLWRCNRGRLASHRLCGWICRYHRCCRLDHGGLGRRCGRGRNLRCGRSQWRGQWRGQWNGRGDCRPCWLAGSGIRRRIDGILDRGRRSGSAGRQLIDLCRSRGAQIVLSLRRCRGRDVFGHECRCTDLYRRIDGFGSRGAKQLFAIFGQLPDRDGDRDRQQGGKYAYAADPVMCTDYTDSGLAEYRLGDLRVTYLGAHPRCRPCAAG